MAVYILTIFLYIYSLPVIEHFIVLNRAMRGIYLVGGIIVLSIYFLSFMNNKIKQIYNEAAAKYSGKVTVEKLFSPPILSFKYNSYPIICSFISGSRYSPSISFFKIQTDFPTYIVIEISYENFIYKSYKKMGIEDQDIKIGDSLFDNKFKIEIKGGDKTFINEILSPEIKKLFISFVGRNPRFFLKKGEIEFYVTDLPLEFDKLNAYIIFLFLIVDHIHNLLHQTEGDDKISSTSIDTLS